MDKFDTDKKTLNHLSLAFYNTKFPTPTSPIDKPHKLKYLNGGDNSNSNATTTTQVENGTRPLLPQRNDDCNLPVQTVNVDSSLSNGGNQLMTVYLNGGTAPQEVEKKIDEDPSGHEINSNARGVFHQVSDVTVEMISVTSLIRGDSWRE